MDVWWLVPQHVLVGVAEVLAVIELEYWPASFTSSGSLCLMPHSSENKIKNGENGKNGKVAVVARFILAF
uniref:Uncharacterized protein n=1 Tax=Oryza barthii TaxID=65489 RepID=A0A0D3FAP8_9ORYZ